MLSRLQREFAAAIASQDWSDAPYRLDRAGHQRDDDRPGRRVEKPLSPTETDCVRTNVMWAVAQVLKHEDPKMDLHVFAAACGVPRSITHRTNGSRSDAITYGLRWSNLDDEMAAPPGAPVYRVRLQCNISNLVVFKRQLAKFADPSLPLPEVDAAGGAGRAVTIIVRAWDEQTAASRALDVVCETSLDVANGAGAAVVSVDPAD
jgi:hypothetical protein